MILLNNIGEVGYIVFKKLKKLFAVEKKNDNSFVAEKKETQSEEVKKESIVKRSEKEQRIIDLAYEAYEKYANISLAYSVEEREIDVPYNSSDDEDIVRFIRKQPKGTPKKIYSLCNVVGVSYRQEEALKAVVGDNLSLRAEKEPTNPYDSNAIKIIADYEENDEKKSVKIGYIPREKAEELVKYNNINVTLRTIYLPDAIAVMYPSKDSSGNLIYDSSGNVGFRIDIWVESQKQKNKKKVFEEQPYDSSIKMPDNFASRNAKAKELEEEGYLDNAIEMYLENTSEDDTSPYPFKRLAIIYRKRKDFENEILIINKALDMFEKRNYEHDKKKKEEMELRLKRVKELKEKEELKKKD